MRAMVTAAVMAMAMTVGVVAQSSPQDIAFTKELTQYVLKGDSKDKRDVAITFTDDALVIAAKKSQSTRIDYASITSIVYDRRARARAMAPQSFGQALDHFVTIQFKTGPTGDFVEIEMGKNAAPSLVATLEARSGKKIERLSGGN